MKFLPQIKRDADGQPDASPELPVQVLMRTRSGTDATISSSAACCRSR